VGGDEIRGKAVFSERIQTTKESSRMQDSRVRTRLKAQLTKVSAQLCEGLSKPLSQFVSQMLLGVQSSQDAKLSNIGRSLGEDIPLIQTEKRLSRNLKKAELERQLTPQ
jgi:hypothetical protein